MHSWGSVGLAPSTTSATVLIQLILLAEPQPQWTSTLLNWNQPTSMFPKMNMKPGGPVAVTSQKRVLQSICDERNFVGGISIDYRGVHQWWAWISPVIDTQVKRKAKRANRPYNFLYQLLKPFQLFQLLLHSIDVQLVLRLYFLFHCRPYV